MGEALPGRPLHITATETSGRARSRESSDGPVPKKVGVGAGGPRCAKLCSKVDSPKCAASTGERDEPGRLRRMTGAEKPKRESVCSGIVDSRWL